MLRSLARSPLFRAGVAVPILFGGLGAWALLHPGGPWLEPWRAESTTVSSRFIFGPYPLEDDLAALKARGVTTIISLLDADLPYEAVLLAQERELAAKYAIEVLNFPMASILGQSFGKDYLANSRAAARAAIDSDGLAYIHCYLGLHRANNVRKLLEEDAATTATTFYGTLEPGRNEEVLAVDRANIAFLEGRYEDSLRELGDIEVRGFEVSVLEGWSNYRLGRIDAAQTAFAQALADRPDAADALAGLGYCALRSGDLDQAARHFGQVLAQNPEDVQAVEGLGYVRYQQGQSGEARILLQRVLAAHPDNNDVRATLERLTAMR